MFFRLPLAGTGTIIRHASKSQCPKYFEPYERIVSIAKFIKGSGLGIVKAWQHISAKFGRRPGDFALLGVTVAEAALLFYLTPSFTTVDWIYVLQHLMVLWVTLTRGQPVVQDCSLFSNAAVVIAYSYPYAQVAYLRWAPGDTVSPAGGQILVTLAACLSFASLLSLGKRFGVIPALRGLMTKGPYRLIRHPMYLAYVLGDIGYNLQEWNIGTALMVLAGWSSLLYRIRAEERMLAHDAGWPPYAALVRYRLIPGVW